MCIFTGCKGKQDSKAITFRAEEIEKIELYHYSVPEEAEKKTVSSQEEIQKICDALHMKLKENKSEQMAGGEITSFQLYFMDGKTTELIYINYGLKTGTIRMSGEESEFQTSADLGAIWDSCGEEPEAVGKNELPSGKKKLSLEKVIELAKKGEELSWDDFYEYASTEYGSGLLILRYEINADYYLLIGGGKKQKPMYIRLVRTRDEENYIDIRTGDIEGFIADNVAAENSGDGADLLKPPASADEGNLNKEIMTGRLLQSSDGKYLIIDENGSPIVMSNQSGQESVFQDLQSGDKIQITYDGILETYPGQMGIYSCELIEKGGIEDISEEVITSLEELGWKF